MNRSLRMRFIWWLIRIAMRRPYWALPGYMERYWLLGGSARDDRPDEALGWKRGRLDAFIGRFIGIRVHKILRSDLERHLHDHPGWFAAWIMIGSYTEVMPQRQGQSGLCDQFDCNLVRVRREQGAIYSHKATDRHRLILDDHSHVWTLFIMGPKRNPWGFYTQLGKVYWRHYERFLQAESNEERRALVMEAGK